MEDKASSIRWQTITVNQLTYASNLILTLIVASIAFEVNLSISKPLDFSNCISRSAFILSLILFSISFVISMLLILNRLKDFRDTTYIAKLREASNNKDGSLPTLREENIKLGKKTWYLFNAQIVTFCIGMALAVISLFDLILKLNYIN